LAFDSESYDTDAIHDNSINNQRLTVPAGITEIKLGAIVQFDSNTTGVRRAAISKNDETTFPAGVPGLPFVELPAGVGGGVPTIINIVSSKINVVATDYFTVAAWHNSGGSLDIDTEYLGYQMCFWMEIIK